MTQYEQWERAAKILQEARQWVAMKGTRAGYENDVFTLRPDAPAKFNLCGQQTCGGQNYWPSPVEFNDALLEVVIGRFDSLAMDALALLAMREQSALVACKGEVDAMQQAIATAWRAARGEAD